VIDAILLIGVINGIRGAAAIRSGGLDAGDTASVFD
jgi:hypothetical protein